MAFDGVYLHCICEELHRHVGNHVDKIHQPTRDEILLQLRGKGGAVKLLLSVAGDRARIHVTHCSVENPPTPPMFCMLLRKHLAGGKLLEVRQDGLERILFFDFACTNELGDRVTRTLVCEVMGRYSNCMLLDEKGILIDSLRRNADITRERVLLSGFPYEMPQRRQPHNFLVAEDHRLLQSLEECGSMRLDKGLLQCLEGVSPLLVREWSYYALRGVECTIAEMTDFQRERLLFAIHRTREKIQKRDYAFTLLQTPEGEYKDFAFFRPEQYGNALVTISCESASETLDRFYSQKDLQARMKQRAGDLFRLVMNRIERVSRKLDNQRIELAQGDRLEEYRLYGELLSANLYQLAKGEAVVTLENYYADNALVHIPLQVNLTPSQNAQRYYTLYRKALTTKEKLSEQIAQGTAELAYLESVFDVLSRAESEAELLLLREELIETGYLKRTGKQKPPKQLPPREYCTSDGYRVLVGRNHHQNDRLTKNAEKFDWWLHTQNIPGSHVILESKGDIPSEKAFVEAAVIAAYHSQARDSAQVPVDYCQIRYVKKPNGAKPGMVIFTNQKTLYVKPDAEQCLGLMKKQ